MAIARGSITRMWLIAQDLSRFRKVCPSCMALIANCPVQTFFRTTELAVRRLGSSAPMGVTTVWFIEM